MRDEAMMGIFYGCLGLLIGVAIGWMAASNSIQTECEKLGAFYINKSVYWCADK